VAEPPLLAEATPDRPVWSGQSHPQANMGGPATPYGLPTTFFYYYYFILNININYYFFFIKRTSGTFMALRFL
jgi:hypothetical protein